MSIPSEPQLMKKPLRLNMFMLSQPFADMSFWQPVGDAKQMA